MDDLHVIFDVMDTKVPENISPLQQLAAATAEDSYKHVVVNLWNVNGNAMIVVGTVKQALKRAGASQLDLAAFVGQALSGDYDHVLATCNKWVTLAHFEPKQDSGSAWEAFKNSCLKGDE